MDAHRHKEVPHRNFLIYLPKLIRLTIGERGRKVYYKILKDTLCIMHNYECYLKSPSSGWYYIIITTINIQSNLKEVALCYV